MDGLNGTKDLMVDEGTGGEALCRRDLVMEFCVGTTAAPTICLILSEHRRFEGAKKLRDLSKKHFKASLRLTHDRYLAQRTI